MLSPTSLSSPLPSPPRRHKHSRPAQHTHQSLLRAAPPSSSPATSAFPICYPTGSTSSSARQNGCKVGRHLVEDKTLLPKRVMVLRPERSLRGASEAPVRPVLWVFFAAYTYPRLCSGSYSAPARRTRTGCGRVARESMRSSRGLSHT